MSNDIAKSLRGPEAYDVARAAIKALEDSKVWPTPVNFELWCVFLANPEGALAQELGSLLATGAPFTDLDSERLAATYLSKAKLDDQIRLAGDQLSGHLSEVGKVISAAQESELKFGRTLSEADRALNSDPDAVEVRAIAKTLSLAASELSVTHEGLAGRLETAARDVQHLQSQLEEARREAMIDGLTQLANRRAFDLRLAQLCDRPTTTPLTVAIIDIDHFKSLNDTWGHQTGDQVLRYIASAIGALARGSRFAARYGGEEFAIMFPGEDAASVHALLNGLRDEVASRQLKRRSTNDDLGTVTISAGFAERDGAETPVTLMDRADTALYRSKHAGRNRVTAAAPSGPDAVAV